MSEQPTDSGNVEATTEITEPILPENIEADTGAKPHRDGYQERVDAILDHHQQQKEYEEKLQKDEIDKQEELYENAKLEEGESWDSIYASMPPNVQRAMASLRADYTRKTQTLAEKRKEVEGIQANLTNSDAYRALQEQARVAEDSGEPFDPFDNTSFQNYVDQKVASQIQKILAPIAEEQLKVASKRKLESFMDEHPELRTDEGLRTEVRDLLLKNEHMNLQQSFWIVMGKRSKQQAAEATAATQQKREINRQVAARIGNGRKQGLTMPPNAKKLSGADIYSYLLAQKK